MLRRMVASVSGCREYPPAADGDLCPRASSGSRTAGFSNSSSSRAARDRQAIRVWQFRDITLRKNEEEELRRSRHRLRNLSAHLEAVREEERRALARTLHDEVGQLLTGIRLEIAGAVERFRQAGTPSSFPVVDRLQAAVGLIDLSVASVQRVATALRPPSPDPLQLLSAMRWEAAVCRRRTGIRCRVSARSLRIESCSHTTVLHRILLEALTNVARHANAGTVWIFFRQRRNGVVMEVRDNGKGIPESALTSPGSMGLLGMRERALAAGGELRISRRPAAAPHCRDARAEQRGSRTHRIRRCLES